MKTIFLAFLFAGAALAQPVISGPNPQVRKGSGPLLAIGTVNNFTGSGAPGNIATSQNGDFYQDTTGQNTYQCYAQPGPCNAVATNNWVQVSSTNGSFTNLTVQTLSVTSPLFNSIQTVGGVVVGGDIGVTGGVTAGTGFTTTSNNSQFGALILNSNSIAALHIPNGGIQIDAGFAPTSITAGGNIVLTGPSGTFQGPHASISGTSTFGADISVTGDVTVSGNVNSTSGSFSTASGGVSVTGNISTSAGQVRVAGAHVILDPSGSIQWANGAGSLDNTGNVNGVNAGFSGTVTAPNFFSNTGNFKISGDNIIMNRAVNTTVQQIQWLVSNNSTNAGSYVLGSDGFGYFALSYGNGSSLSEVFTVQPSLTQFYGGTTQIGSSGSILWGNPLTQNGVVNPTNITLNRASGSTGHFLNFVTGGSGTNVGSIQITPDVNGTIDFKAGNGSSQVNTATLDRSGNLALTGGITGVSAIFSSSSSLSVSTSGGVSATGGYTANGQAGLTGTFHAGTSGGCIITLTGGIVTATGGTGC